jgi:hypothetical protein
MKNNNIILTIIGFKGIDFILTIIGLELGYYELNGLLRNIGQVNGLLIFLSLMLLLFLFNLRYKRKKDKEGLRDMKVMLNVLMFCLTFPIIFNIASFLK